MAKAMLVIFIMLLCSFVSFVIGGTGEVCFPFGSQDHPDPTAQHEPAQGRPGKIGPAGPIGPPGPTGAPGTCACDPSEVDQLRDEIRVLEGRWKS